MGSSSSMGVLHTQGTGPLQGPAARSDRIGEQIGRRGAHNSPNPMGRGDGAETGAFAPVRPPVPIRWTMRPAVG